MGKTCARGQTALQGLYNPDRIQYPAKRSQRGSEILNQVTWDDAVPVISEALTTNQPGEIAFLLGLNSDHLADLVTEITTALGATAPMRTSAFETVEARATLAN